MAKPESHREGGTYCARGLLAGVGVALVAVAALAVSVVYLDARRQEQQATFDNQLEMLRQLVDSMQRQLEQHEERINSTFHSRSTVNSEVADEVIYEDEYEYDDEEDSYEYEDEEEPEPKATVKRTVVLSESTPYENSSATEQIAPNRTRRDVSSHSVPQREERYVPSTPNLKAFFDSKNKSEGLRIYATYFGKGTKYVNIHEKTHRLRHSSTEPLNNQDEAAVRSSQHGMQQPNHQPLSSLGYQEQRRPQELRVRMRHGGRYRNTHMDDVEPSIHHRPIEEMGEQEQPARPNVLAAHFVGDASIYNNSRNHRHYYGNNMLFHPHGLFKDWRPSDWMYAQRVLSYFPIQNGKLIIQEPGVYFVYAQIYYVGTHDRCGFHIKQNGEEVGQCLTTTTGRESKQNTCFTAVILHLHKFDNLWFSEVEGHRNTSFKSSHSFFGLIQIKSLE